VVVPLTVKPRDARIDKVSAKVELTESAPQVVNNP
jgi:hypothetical protein